MPWHKVQSEAAALYLMAFLMQLGLGIMGPVLPEVKRAFGVTTAEVSLTVSAFGLARLVLDIPTGYLVDRVRPFHLFLAGTAVIVAGGLAGWLAADFGWLIVARGLMGAGSAVCMMTAQYTLSGIAGPGSRGRILGMYQAALLGGLSLSPAIGGALAVSFGWRSSFLFCAVAGLFAFASVVSTQRPRVEAAATGRKAKAAHGDAQSRFTRRGQINVALVDLVTVALFLHASGFYSTVVPLIGGIRLGLDAGSIGLAIAVTTALRFFLSILGGEASDRFGRRAVLLPGLFLVGLGSVGFNFATDMPTYMLAMVVMAVGRFGNSLPVTIIIDNTPAHLWGKAMATNRFLGDLGVVIGPVMLGWLVDNVGYEASAYVAAGIVWLAMVLSIVGFRELPRRPVVAKAPG